MSIITDPNNKNTSSMTELWTYSRTAYTWSLSDTCTNSGELQDAFTSASEDYLCLIRYVVKPGMERPTDKVYPFSNGEIVWCKNTFYVIVSKNEETGLCLVKKYFGKDFVTDIENSQSEFKHCYLFSDAQTQIDLLVDELETQRTKLLKLSDSLLEFKTK